jgi:hypothetical protein
MQCKCNWLTAHRTSFWKNTTDGYVTAITKKSSKFTGSRETLSAVAYSFRNNFQKPKTNSNSQYRPALQFSSFLSTLTYLTLINEKIIFM